MLSKLFMVNCVQEAESYTCQRPQVYHFKFNLEAMI